MKKLDTLSHDVTRRKFLQMGALGTAGLVAAACAGGGGEAAAEDMPAPAAETESQAPAAASSSSLYNEAPMLADMVASGDLPPVDERVPANPLVLEGMEGVGNYGGVMRRGST